MFESMILFFRLVGTFTSTVYLLYLCISFINVHLSYLSIYLSIYPIRPYGESMLVALKLPLLHPASTRRRPFAGLAQKTPRDAVVS